MVQSDDKRHLRPGDPSAGSARPGVRAALTRPSSRSRAGGVCARRRSPREGAKSRRSRINKTPHDRCVPNRPPGQRLGACMTLIYKKITDRNVAKIETAIATALVTSYCNDRDRSQRSDVVFAHDKKCTLWPIMIGVNYYAFASPSEEANGYMSFKICVLARLRQSSNLAHV
ncbi:hypothetical protein EVAR_92579_1 [Eumeta japonica]|uniref:Uncharacterized protein n=1 Tax=Eumeta variegata TaxID=151549 RepID=A0A4C1SZ91_EUMVA|nr:hypothetical protein EVAR_92579_1 [Eumeta japonica]